MVAIGVQMWYGSNMSKVADKPKDTTLVAVTTMEEVPVLSAEERAELVASLRDAEKEVVEGRGAVYDSDEMRRRFARGFKSRNTPPGD
jgi:hypothetical protein